MNKAKKTKISKKTKVTKKRSKHPKIPKQSEEVKKINHMIYNDRRITVNEIASTLKISADDVLRILSEESDYTQKYGQWRPGFLQFDQKYNRVEASTKLLTQLKRDRRNFLCRFVTVDQMWFYHNHPNAVEQSKESDAPPAKKSKTDQTIKKIRAIIFWDAFGAILIDYPKRNQKITPAYYAKLLDRLAETMKVKRPKLGKKSILLQQNDTWVEESIEVGSKAYRLNMEKVPHSTYWLDLAPSIFYLFPKLEEEFVGRRFSTDKAIIEAVDAYFESRDEYFFREGIEALEERWNKCIKARGEYFE